MENFERSHLYFPIKEFIASPAQFGLTFHDVTFSAADGTVLHGWLIPGAINGALYAAHVTVLYAHGNGGNISHRLDKARLFHQLGLDLFLFDYRGFGRSQGEPSEQGTYRDADAAYDFLTGKKSVLPGDLVLYGESLGGAVALDLALRRPSRQLILESTFSSTVAMARRLFPGLPVESIIRYRYDNESKIGKLKVPLLIMHSRSDQTVPFTMAQQLFARAPEPKTFLELKGSHVTGYRDSLNSYVNAILEFIKTPVGAGKP